MLLLALAIGMGAVEEVKPVAGTTLEVQHSVRVAAGSYVLPPLGEDGRRGVIRVEAAKDVVLDLTDVELRGTPPGTDLDRNRGSGIVLVGCTNVTVKGGKLGGFRGCLVAENCTV